MAKAKARPFRILFMAHVRSARFRDFVEAMLDLLSRHRFPPIEEWRTADGADGDAASLADAVAALPNKPPKDADPLYLEFSTGENLNGGVQLEVDEDGDALCIVDLRRVIAKEDKDADLVSFQTRCLALCTEMLNRFDLFAAQLRPEGGGGSCVPDVALIAGNSHIAAVEVGEVEDSYDDPDAFWKAGWTIHAERDGNRLLVRDLDVVTEPEYLRRIIDHQWDMARAAGPGENAYQSPDVGPDEKPVFFAGDARLHAIGYDKDEKLIEYSCALNSGEHIQGWEVFALLDIIESKQTPDGSPVETVRIVFLDEWAAREEKRPLLDIGCRVFHYDDQGALIELKE
jgi:hypothetical protein